MEHGAPGVRARRGPRFSNAEPAEAASRADVVFVALGHGESAHLMTSILEQAPRLVIDMAADFRLADEESYRRHYGAHPNFALAPRFVYGLSEARRDAVARAECVANPGCMATSAALALWPLAKEGLLPDDAAVFAVTGSSGAGGEPKPTTHHPFRASNLFVYKPLAHQHEAEIARVLSEDAGRDLHPRLIAHSGPFVRGIHAAAHLRSEEFKDRDVRALYADAYAREPFVTLRDEPPAVADAQGTNHAHLFVKQQGREVLVLCVIDNLGKGAAGQAVQNMNIALGLPETDGLGAPGFFPY
ncbi:MAG: N-acetyl-gamma-glutamyl-phosphate reductase [Deltaproteobacteria bacterium]|nr:N-acetyl-gamma-glutamyl-phosphate reductase [Deltaproteobacteria bacterium]